MTRVTRIVSKIYNLNINQVKNSQNLGYKEEIATVIKISPKKIKMELEKHGIKIIETGKNSTRNFKRVNDDLNQKSSNIDKNVVYNSSSGMTNFQSTFNYGTQNMFSRNVKNQLNTISPDLISRQTLDNSSIYKLMNKEKPAEENKKLNDNIKILNSNYYNNIKVLLLLKQNTNQNFLTFLNNNKINESKSKNGNNFPEKKKPEINTSKNKVDYKTKYKIFRSSKSPLNSDKLVLLRKKTSDVENSGKFTNNKNYPMLIESSHAFPNPNSARINYK